MLLLSFIEILELFLELVNALACALIMLSDSDGLLFLLDLLLLFEPDLSIVLFFAALKLC